MIAFNLRGLNPICKLAGRHNGIHRQPTPICLPSTAISEPCVAIAHTLSNASEKALTTLHRQDEWFRGIIEGKPPDFWVLERPD